MAAASFVDIRNPLVVAGKYPRFGKARQNTKSRDKVIRRQLILIQLAPYEGEMLRWQHFLKSDE